MHNHAAMTELQGHARLLGRFFTALAAAMSGYAGWMMGGESLYASICLAGVFAGLTYATAIFLPFIDRAFSAGEKNLARALCAVFTLLVFGEYMSHVAFQTGHRAVGIDQANFKTVTHEDTRVAVANSEQAIAMWTNRIKHLEESNPWSTSVTADALRARLASANLAIKVEEARGGCKTQCLARTKERDELSSRIAIIEQTDDARKELDKARTELKKAQDRAASTPKGESIAQNQSALFATAATGSLTPTVAAMQWANIGVGAFVGLLSTILGTVMNWLGFHSFGKREDEPAAPAPKSDLPPPSSGLSSAIPASHPALTHGTNTHTREVLAPVMIQKDDTAWAKVWDSVAQRHAEPKLA